MSSSIITSGAAATNAWKLGSRAESPSSSARRATVGTSSKRPWLSRGVSGRLAGDVLMTASAGGTRNGSRACERTLAESSAFTPWTARAPAGGTARRPPGRCRLGARGAPSSLAMGSGLPWGRRVLGLCVLGIRSVGLLVEVYLSEGRYAC